MFFYSRGLGKAFQMAVSTGYSGFRAPGLKTKRMPTYSFSWAWKASATLNFGGTLGNPFVLKGGTEKPARTIHSGFEIKPSNQVGLRVWLLSDEGRGGRMLAAIEYFPEPRIIINAGWVSSETLFMFSGGFLYKRWKVSVGTTYHFLLGLSPQLSLQIMPPKND